VDNALGETNLSIYRSVDDPNQKQFRSPKYNQLLKTILPYYTQKINERRQKRLLATEPFFLGAYILMNLEFMAWLNLFLYTKNQQYIFAGYIFIVPVMMIGIIMGDKANFIVSIPLLMI